MVKKRIDSYKEIIMSNYEYQIPNYKIQNPNSKCQIKFKIQMLENIIYNTYIKL